MIGFVLELVYHHPDLFTNELGPLVDNYPDDIWFLADIPEKNLLQFMIAEWWADWLGIELYVSKREPPRSARGHLGFHLDLKEKIVTLTNKHKRK